MIVGVVGLGSIGKRHARNLLAMGHAITGFDIMPSAGLELGINVSDCLGFQSCDAVVIASPTNEHSHGALRAIRDRKHVFIEKPMAASLAQAEEIMEDARYYDRTVMVGNNMRYHPVVKLVKERMFELGGPYLNAWFMLKQKNTKYTEPVTLNWGAHEVDLALYLLDKKLGVMEGQSKVSQDEAKFVLRNGSGPLVHIHLDYLMEPQERSFAIHGPEASIHGDLENLVVHIFKNGSREIIAVEGSHDQTYVEEMEEFIRRVEGKPPDGIGATGEDGLRCLKLLLEAQNGI